MAPFKTSTTQKGGSSDLRKPFTSHECRSLVDQVDSFVRDRAQTDKIMLEAAERLHHSNGPSAQLQREELTEMSLRMKAREQKLKRRQLRALAKREELYEMDPTDARARDIVIVKDLLAKLYNQFASPTAGNIESLFSDSESEKPADNSDYHSTVEPELDSLKHKSDKKNGKEKAETNNAMSFSTHEVETFQGTESHASTPAHQDTQQKKRKKSKSLHANDLNDANEGELPVPSVSPNNTPGLKKGLKRSKSFSAESAKLPEIRDDKSLANQGGPEKKKHKRSKLLSGNNTELSKSIAVRENGDAVDMSHGKYVTLSAARSTREERDESGDSFIVEGFQDEPTNTRAKKVRAGEKSRKEKRSRGNHDAKKPEDPNNEEHAAVSADVKDSTALGKMKKPHRKSSLNIDDQNVSSEQTNYDNPTSTGQPAFRLAKSTPTRIEPPVVAGQHRRPEFRRPLFNPFFGLQKFSVQNPEPIWSPPKQTLEDTKTSELNASQIWTPGTRNAGENSKSESSDAKRTATTSGRVTKHGKTDAASPTPLPKKEQKKRGRPKEVKEPATAQALLPAAAHTSVSSTSAQASGTLVQPTASLTALLGSGDRAEQLMKKLEQDKQMLTLEAEAWHKAMKF